MSIEPLSVPGIASVRSFIVPVASLMLVDTNAARGAPARDASIRMSPVR